MLKMNKDPIISVIMPVYNAEKYLDEAIQSILNQTYKDFEFIIINDGSTDKSLTIIEKHRNIDERIVLINRENRGLIASLNEGILKARGKYIARMDADDISLPKRFEEQTRLMETEHLDICGCHYYLINEYNDYIDSALVPLHSNAFLNYLCITTPFAHPSILIRKEFLIQNQLFYGQTLYKNAEDYALWIEFWNKGAKFGNVNQFLFKYRDFESSLSKVNNRKISLDKQKISKNFILHNQKILIQNLRNLKMNILQKREREIIVLILFTLCKYRFKFSYLKLVMSIGKKFTICGLFKFLKERY